MKLITTRRGLGALFLVLVLVAGILPMPASAAPPAIPTPQNPGYSTQFGEVISTLTPTLQWSSVSGGNNYHVAIRHYSGSWDSGPIVLDQGYIYSTSYKVPSGVLEAGESYRWNVRAFNSGGEDSDWSSRLYFQTTSSAPTSAPSLYSPGHTSTPGPTDSTTRPTFSWSNVNGATSYNLYISQAPYGEANQVRAITGISGTSHTLTSSQALPDNTDYRWTATGQNSGGEGPYSTQYRYFGIQTTTTISPPSTAPSLYSPGYTSTPGEIHSTTRPTFSWSSVSGATSYNLYVSKAPYGAANQVLVKTGLTSTSYTPASSQAFADNTDYRWTATGQNSGGEGPESTAYRYFRVQTTTTTTPPSTPPTLYSPGHTSAPGEGLITRTPTFSWSSVSGATSYNLYISQAPYGEANQVRAITGISGTSHTLTSSQALPDNTDYRWTATGQNSGGEGPYSTQYRYFGIQTTTTSTAPTVAPSLSVPGYVSAPGETIATTTPSFSWSSVSGATSYNLYVSKAPYGAANQVLVKTGLTSTSYTLSAGQAFGDNTDFRWTATASNSGGEGPVNTAYRYFRIQSSTTAAEPSSAQTGDLWGAVQTVSSDPDVRVAMMMAAALETGRVTGPFPDQYSGGPGRGPFQIEAGPGGNPPCAISEEDARDAAKAANCMLSRFKTAVAAVGDYTNYANFFAALPQCGVSASAPPPAISADPALAYATIACLAERPASMYGPRDKIDAAWALAAPFVAANAPPEVTPSNEVKQMQPQSGTGYFFVHGICSDGEMWTKPSATGNGYAVWNSLTADGSRYLTPTYGGEPGDDPYSMKDDLQTELDDFLAGKTGQVRDAPGPQRVHPLQDVVIVGHSNGGLMARWLLSENSERVKRVITLDSPDAGADHGYAGYGLLWMTGCPAAWVDYASSNFDSDGGAGVGGLISGFFQTVGLLKVATSTKDWIHLHVDPTLYAPFDQDKVVRVVWGTCKGLDHDSSATARASASCTNGDGAVDQSAVETNGAILLSVPSKKYAQTPTSLEDITRAAANTCSGPRNFKAVGINAAQWDHYKLVDSLPNYRDLMQGSDAAAMAGLATLAANPPTGVTITATAVTARQVLPELYFTAYHNWGTEQFSSTIIALAQQGPSALQGRTYDCDLIGKYGLENIAGVVTLSTATQSESFAASGGAQARMAPFVQTQAYQTGFTMTAEPSNNKLSLVRMKVNSPTSPGKIVVVNADPAFWAVADSRIGVWLDNKPVQEAKDYADLTSDISATSTAKYLLVKGAVGHQFLIWVPHFSERTIEIAAIEDADQVFVSQLGLISLAAALLLTVGVAYGMGRRQGRKGT